MLWSGVRATIGMENAEDPKLRISRPIRWAAIAVLTVTLLILSFALVGVIGLGLAFIAIALRLMVTRALILKFHPRFRSTRQLSRIGASKAHDIVEELADKAKLASVPMLLESEDVGLEAESILTSQGSVILLSKHMLKRFSDDELSNILALEMGRIRNCDGYIIWSSSLAVVLASTCVLAGSLFGWSHFEGLNNVASLGRAQMIEALILLCIFTMIFNLVLRRRLAFDADLTAAEITGNPIALASALAKQNPSYLNGWSSILDVHPSTSRRIDRLRHLPSLAMENEQ